METKTAEESKETESKSQLISVLCSKERNLKNKKENKEN